MSDRATPYWQSECGRAAIYLGDCRDVLPQLPPSQFCAAVTDPPYELGFMNKGWDSSGVAYDVRTWSAVSRVCRPGTHLLSFGGSRAYHRMACAVEDAQWEVRDTIMWVYGTGFPKGLDVSRAIDEELGFSREQENVHRRSSVMGTNLHRKNGAGAGGYGYAQEFGTTRPVTDTAAAWDGWNTALKPAWEPIVLARSGVPTTVASCVMDHGTGALNVDKCRVGTTGTTVERSVTAKQSSGSNIYAFNGPNKSTHLNKNYSKEQTDGRYPANVVHDGSDDVIAALGEASQFFKCCPWTEDDTERSRLYYTAKANGDDRPHGRGTVVHPTVKPLDLMRYLVRLSCVPGGTVLDPFCGSGSTGCAAILEGMRFVGVELGEQYADISIGRIKLALAEVPVPAALPGTWRPTRGAGGGAPPPSRRLRGTSG